MDKPIEKHNMADAIRRGWETYNDGDADPSSVETYSDDEDFFATIGAEACERVTSFDDDLIGLIVKVAEVAFDAGEARGRSRITPTPEAKRIERAIRTVAQVVLEERDELVSIVRDWQEQTESEGDLAGAIEEALDEWTAASDALIEAAKVKPEGMADLAEKTDDLA
jgi:hypothetical protein